MDVSVRRLILRPVCVMAVCFAAMLAASGAHARVVIEYHAYGAKAQVAIQQNRDFAAKLDAAFKLPCIDKKAFDELEFDVVQAANAANELARVTDTKVDIRPTEEEGIPADLNRIDKLRNDLSTSAQANTDRLDALKARICRELPRTNHTPNSGQLGRGESVATAPGGGDTHSATGVICHQCEWIATQISDIDDKNNSWERQIRSLSRNSNLSDPKIQAALKDIANKIAALKAKKAALQVKLAECQQRCAAVLHRMHKPKHPHAITEDDPRYMENYQPPTNQIPSRRRANPSHTDGPPPNVPPHDDDGPKPNNPFDKPPDLPVVTPQHMP
jgi:hypothetical protein